ncbi:MAG TPA: gliding motility-associated C-terminal domain-containing protein [Chitinophagaceae bacterium]|nr:gliding motility-associated C-terminal domain-containing protein [Chitinophagaceae bacterium]
MATDCPNDGFYTVRTNTANCFGNSWHTVNSDHTGDPGGYFMLVNASFQPSAFYLDTVKGLCAGTTYEFAAWVMNVLKQTSCTPDPTQPNLTFTIESTDGNVLQSYNTNTIGSIASPQWRQFGFYFTTPANATDIVLRIFNNAPGGCGNDLALDDITFRPCGPQLKSVFVGSQAETMTICEGETRSFGFECSVSTGFNNPSFIWQYSADAITWSDIPGATSTLLVRDFNAATPPGNYYYRLSAAESGNMGSAQCRIASNQLLVKVGANPVITLSSNSALCQNQDLLLTASGGSTYEWSGTNNFSASTQEIRIPNAQPSDAGKYYVMVTSLDGCTSLDSISIIVNPTPTANILFADSSICEGENIQLISNGGTSYQWTPADGLSSTNISSPIASPVSTTTYNVVASNSFGCSDTSNILIRVLEAPRANAGPDLWIIEGTTVQLQATATGYALSYSWSPDIYISNVSELQPFITPLRDTIYKLTVSSNAGCGTDIDSMNVFVYKDVFVPTAFSPNNDGLNDTWHIPVLVAYPEFELSVFNREGRNIFQAKGVNKPWDGTYRGEPQPAGIYVYMLDLKDGSPTRKGTLMLLR